MSVRHSGIGMTSQRTRMRMIERLRTQGIADEVVLSVMGAIPRHIFVEEALASRAYEDVALPINYGQTISSPWIVARMSELLRNHSDLGKVLEIGTGCGYQTAVLAKIAQKVYSVERIGPLLTRTRLRLIELQIRNTHLRHADGLHGFIEEQLEMGGRMVFPKGTRKQNLCIIERTPQGYTETVLEEVNFVPLLAGVVKK